jgi:predicted cobalt transporter CbtA
MKKNVGGYDRLIRFVVGPVLVAVGLAALAGLFTLAAGTAGLLLAVVGILVGGVLLVTGYTQKCPLNNLVGLDTYRGAGERLETEESSPTDRSA